MGLRPEIDVKFDLRSDTPAGKDPDQHSPTLRRYHQLLWSKPLPSGVHFHLDTSDPRRYLHHVSDLGEFVLSSDASIRTFRNLGAARAVLAQVPTKDQESFSRQGYTIGGMMIFPAQRVDGKPTINGARGMHPRIADRFDLTLEAIRRHYAGGDSPIAGALARYSGFFNLFGDFRGYVEFFLLQDLVSSDYSNVQFWSPFADFTTPPVPATLEEYTSYRTHALQFVKARNSRIAAGRR
ncbi:MAG: hypothetical protein KF761_03845 [Salinibacterium sp.]|nr:hypothetical protein [Salinibacterium sp.]